MPNPLIVGLIVFAVVLAGAFAGWTTKQRLPKHHLTDETKNVVSVSMAVVATVSALVLGLLISNANTKFSVLEGEVTTLSAEILRLDQILRRYGPDANPARETLRQYAEQKTDDLFPKDPANVRLGSPSTYELLQQLEDLLLAMKPATLRDHWWLGQAMSLAAKMGDIRWLLAQQIGQGTPKAFVALLASLSLAGQEHGRTIPLADQTQHCKFSCKPDDHVFANVDASADFISVHELSRQIIGKGSYLERGSTTTRVNGVHLDPIKLIIGKDRDELPGLEFGPAHPSRGERYSESRFGAGNDAIG